MDNQNFVFNFWKINSFLSDRVFHLFYFYSENFNGRGGWCYFLAWLI